MHRRSYLPGSHVKRNRARLLDENKGLQGRVEDMAGTIRRQNYEITRLRDVEAKTLRSRVRRLMDRVRRLIRVARLTRPVAA